MWLGDCPLRWDLDLWASLDAADLAFSKDLDLAADLAHREAPPPRGDGDGDSLPLSCRVGPVKAVKASLAISWQFLSW